MTYSRASLIWQLLMLGNKARLAVESLGINNGMSHSNDIRKVFLCVAQEPHEGIVRLTILYSSPEMEVNVS